MGNVVPNGGIVGGESWTVDQWNGAWQGVVSAIGGMLTNGTIVNPTVTAGTWNGGVITGATWSGTVTLGDGNPVYFDTAQNHSAVWDAANQRIDITGPTWNTHTMNSVPGGNVWNLNQIIYAASTADSGQHVAGYNQMVNYGNGGTKQLWAGVCEMHDNSGNALLGPGDARLGLEVDIVGNGATNGGERAGIVVVLEKSTAGTAPVVGSTGLQVVLAGGGTTNGWFQNAIQVTSGVTQAAVDLRSVSRLETIFVGGISGNTLTVASITYGLGLELGMTITSGAASGTTVTAFGTGTGGAGTYTVSISQTVSGGTTFGANATGIWLGDGNSISFDTAGQFTARYTGSHIEFDGAVYVPNGLTCGAGLFDGGPISSAAILTGTQAAITTTAATIATTGAALHIADNQRITFDSAGLWDVFYDSATSRLKVNYNGTDIFSIDASGNVRAKGTITASTTP